MALFTGGPLKGTLLEAHWPYEGGRSKCPKVRLGSIRDRSRYAGCALHALLSIIFATSFANFTNAIKLYGARNTGKGRLPASADRLISV
jgi:hypothetical protein